MGEVSTIQSPVTSPSHNHTTELDSNADASCVGKNVKVLYECPGRIVDVTPFLKSLAKVECAPIVSAAVMYDDMDRTSHMPVIHQAIFFAEMYHSLLCPMQIRDSGLELNEKPKFQCDRLAKNDYALVLLDGKIIPLGLVGITLFFPTRKSTLEEEERFSDVRFGTIRKTLVEQTYYELTASKPE